jgi:2-polyprenyl-6-methoxyphenol hydroxylase-like FAD-dependent oxidoreductase
VSLRLADGRRLAAKLLVAADGRESLLRQWAQIPVLRWSYPQTGIVATVAHELPHEGVAHEHFLPSGPFAMLPMTGNRSSIVWTERRDLAAAMMALDAEDFAAEIERRFGLSLGRIRLVGRRWPTRSNLCMRPATWMIALRSSAMPRMPFTRLRGRASISVCAISPLWPKRSLMPHGSASIRARRRHCGVIKAGDASTALRSQG